jgi:hypothetical protein
MLAVADEFEDCHFGDLRLAKRVQALASSISENPERGFPFMLHVVARLRARLLIGFFKMKIYRQRAF